MPWLADAFDTEPYWPSVDEVDPGLLTSLLASARIQCEAFAPSLTTTLEDGTTVTADPPGNYLMAQAMQARALYRAHLAGSNDRVGVDGLAVTVYPLDWQIKALLRPKRGKPAIA